MLLANTIQLLSTQTANMLVVGVLLAAVLVLRDASRSTR